MWGGDLTTTAVLTATATPTLEVCKISDPRYQAIRDRHYVPNRGCHGQQLHFLVWNRDEIVGIISGASSVYAVKARDDFFGITKQNREMYLPAIINNTVFRLEVHQPNLATQVLAKWRRATAELWEQIYGVPVIGFETFVVETDYRKGTLYKADNWTFVGETSGNTKTHNGLTTSHSRLTTEKKLVYCRWLGRKPVEPTVAYRSSWRAVTDEERERKRRISQLRESLIGQRF